MRQSLLSLAVLATLVTPVLSFADDVAAPAAEPVSPHTVTYNN